MENPIWPKRLSDSLTRVVSETDAGGIMEGSEKLETLDETGKAE